MTTIQHFKTLSLEVRFKLEVLSVLYNTCNILNVSSGVTSPNPISQRELTLVSQVRGNRGVETFEEVFGSFGRGGDTIFHSFL